jgi:hypothetical protein
MQRWLAHGCGKGNRQAIGTAMILVAYRHGLRPPTLTDGGTRSISIRDLSGAPNKRARQPHPIRGDGASAAEAGVSSDHRYIHL